MFLWQIIQVSLASVPPFGKGMLKACAAVYRFSVCGSWFLPSSTVLSRWQPQAQSLENFLPKVLDAAENPKCGGKGDFRLSGFTFSTMFSFCFPLPLYPSVLKFLGFEFQNDRQNAFPRDWKFSLVWKDLLCLFNLLRLHTGATFFPSFLLFLFFPSPPVTSLHQSSFYWELSLATPSEGMLSRMDHGGHLRSCSDVFRVCAHCGWGVPGLLTWGWALDFLDSRIVFLLLLFVFFCSALSASAFLALSDYLIYHQYFNLANSAISLRLRSAFQALKIIILRGEPRIEGICPGSNIAAYNSQ